MERSGRRWERGHGAEIEEVQRESGDESRGNNYGRTWREGAKGVG